MEKKKVFDYLYVFLIILNLLLVAGLFWFMNSNGGKCVKSPVRYFLDQNEGASCFCTNAKGKVYNFGAGSMPVVNVTNDGINYTINTQFVKGGN